MVYKKTTTLLIKMQINSSKILIQIGIDRQHQNSDLKYLRLVYLKNNTPVVSKLQSIK